MDQLYSCVLRNNNHIRVWSHKGQGNSIFTQRSLGSSQFDHTPMPAECQFCRGLLKETQEAQLILCRRELTVCCLMSTTEAQNRASRQILLNWSTCGKTLQNYRSSPHEKPNPPSGLVWNGMYVVVWMFTPNHLHAKQTNVLLGLLRALNVIHKLEGYFWILSIG